MGQDLRDLPLHPKARSPEGNEETTLDPTMKLGEIRDEFRGAGRRHGGERGEYPSRDVRHSRQEVPRIARSSEGIYNGTLPRVPH